MFQVGARLLPKLPEGTKVGKLVMGKRGLYKPGLYEKTQLFFVSSLELTKLLLFVLLRYTSAKYVNPQIHPIYQFY